MIDGRTVLVVVPARGGSKGLKLKNLREINGRSLVALVGDVSKRLSYVDRAVISTDDERIATEAEEWGLGAPFRRPDDLSGDRVSDYEVLIHALMEMESIDGVQYDVVVMLQPTSPLRKAKHVTATVEKLLSCDLDAVWTVSETDSKHHPLKQLKIEEEKLGYYDSRGRDIVARQQLDTLYHRNGAAYAMTRQCLLEQATIMGKRTSAVVIEEPMISIDTEFDLSFAEFVSRIATEQDR